MPVLFTKPRSAVRAIALARGISITGGAAAFAALNLQIEALTGSVFWLAASLFLTFGVAGLVGPFAGLLGDRYDRQKIMIYSDLVAGAFFLIMAFVDSPSWLLFFAFWSAVGEAPMISASGAAIPNLVKNEEDIPWANSMLQIGWTTGIMLGPAIGGVLFDIVGPKPIFIANTVSFLLSAALVAVVRGDFKDRDRGETEEEHRGMRAGLVFLWKDRALRFMTAAWIVVVLGMGIALTADIPLAELFDPSGAGGAYGFMIAAWCGGSVLGSILGRKLTKASEGNVLVWGMIVVGLSLASVGISPIFLGVLAGIFISGFADALTMVAEAGIMQRRAPDAVRSRVIAASHAVISLAFAASFVVAPFLIEWLGPKVAYILTGVACLGGVCFLLPVRRILHRALVPQAPAEGAEAEDERAGSENVAEEPRAAV